MEKWEYKLYDMKNITEFYNKNIGFINRKWNFYILKIIGDFCDTL